MKNLLTFPKLASLFVAALCLTLAGCGKSSKSSSSGKSSGSASASAGDGAIAFHNKLVDFTKQAREPFKKIMQTSKDSLDWVERSGVVGEKPMWNLVLSGINPYEKLAKNNLKAPTSFSKEDQEFFNSRIESVKKDTGELNTIIADLIKYYKAEDYKDDKHQKSIDLQTRIKALVQNAAQSCGEMMDRSEEIASAVERESLKKNPIGIYILNMRDLMEKCDEQLDVVLDERLLLVGSGTNFTDASKAEDAAKVKDLTDEAEEYGKEIASMAAEFKAVNRDALKKRPQLEKDYDNFFKILEAQQDVMRKNIRHAKEFGNIGTRSDMELLKGEYRRVVGAHNSFIDSVNKSN